MYTLEYKKHWHAKLIGGKNEDLIKAESIKSIDGAEWIWPRFCCRALLMGKLECETDCTAKALFYCDNIFDLYVNGEMAASEVKEFDGTFRLKKGINTVAIRAYQTSCDDCFTSAIAGKLTYNDGKEKEFVTNGQNYKWIFVPVFFETPEPDNWILDGGDERALCCCPIHPRLYKRSLYLRGKAELKKNVKNAVMTVFTKGEADIFIGGKPISNEIFGQGIMDKIQEIREYDVTHLVKKGLNIITAITANTWLNSESHSVMMMNKPYLLAELEVEYTDGETEYFGTDKSWKAYFSPYTDNDLQFGERYDARREIDGVHNTDFDDSYFFGVEEKEPVGEYVYRNYEGVTVEKTLDAVSEKRENDDFVFDFGINCMGKYSIKLKDTKAGQKIKISFAESLLADGSFNTRLYKPVFFIRDIEQGKASNVKNFDVYVCKGAAFEEFSPHFSFSGMRYIKIEGLADREQLCEIKLCVMRTGLCRNGNISTSYAPAMLIHDTSRHTFDSNLLNGAMDCPTREKNYWTGDMQVFCPTAFFFEDGEKLFSRWSHAGRKMCTEQYGWGDEAYILPLTLYRFYGDKSILEACFDNMMRLFENRYEESEILPSNPNSPFNDHLMPGSDDVADNIDPKFFAHAYHCHMLDSLRKVCEILDKANESRFFGRLFDMAKAEFIKRYYIPSEKNFTPHLQTGLVLPLAFGLYPEGEDKKIASTLNDYILNRDKCINAGIIGCKYILRVLCDYGYKAAAFFLINNDKYPSWRYTLSTGATTFTETWYGLESHLNASMNHFSLGSIASWFYECLGGIRYLESEPGFKKLVLKPVFIKEIGDFDVTFKSKSGNIRSAWKFENDGVHYSFEAKVPITLILPDGSSKEYDAGGYSLVV